jgi:hypothetical protein
MEKIKLTDVLNTMHYKDASGKPSVFSFSVYSLNRFSKTGGTLKEYKNVSISHFKKSEKKQTVKDQRDSLQYLPKKKRSANHKKNRTINIDVPGINHPVTVHFRIITKFNNKTVHY